MAVEGSPAKIGKRKRTSGAVAKDDAKAAEKRVGGFQLPSFMTGNLEGHISAFYEVGQGLLPITDDDGYGYISWKSSSSQSDSSCPEVAHYRFGLGDLSEKCLEVLRTSDQACQNIMVSFVGLGRSNLGQWIAKNVEFLSIAKDPSKKKKKLKTITTDTQKASSTKEGKAPVAVEMGALGDSKAQKAQQDFDEQLQLHKGRDDAEQDREIAQLETLLQDAVKSENKHEVASIVLHACTMFSLPVKSSVSVRPSQTVLRRWLRASIKNADRTDDKILRKLIPGLAHVKKIIETYESTGQGWDNVTAANHVQAVYKTCKEVLA